MYRLIILKNFTTVYNYTAFFAERAFAEAAKVTLYDNI